MPAPSARHRAPRPGRRRGRYIGQCHLVPQRTYRGCCWPAPRWVPSLRTCQSDPDACPPRMASGQWLNTDRNRPGRGPGAVILCSGTGVPCAVRSCAACSACSACSEAPSTTPMEAHESPGSRMVRTCVSMARSARSRSHMKSRGSRCAGMHAAVRQSVATEVDELQVWRRVVRVHVPHVDPHSVGDATSQVSVQGFSPLRSSPQVILQVEMGVESATVTSSCSKPAGAASRPLSWARNSSSEA